MFNVNRFSLNNKDSAISTFQELLLKFLAIILKFSQLTLACPDSTECFKIYDFKSLLFCLYRGVIKNNSFLLYLLLFVVDGVVVVAVVIFVVVVVV